MTGLTPLRLGLFSPSLPHLVAIREGYYEERGLTVEQQRIHSSSGLFRALRDGDVDAPAPHPGRLGPHPQCLAILRWPTAQEEV